MKRFAFLFVLLTGVAAFMFAQASPQAANPQAPPPNMSAPAPDNDHNLNTPQSSDSAPIPDNQGYPQDPQDRDNRDQNRTDRDSNQDRDRQQPVYDRDPNYQDQDRRDQQDRDRDRDQDRDRDRDMNHDRDNDMDRGHDRDRSRVGVGGDLQSQIYSALHNDRRLSDVNVAVNGNRIDLTGTVPTGRDRNEAMRIAQQYANGMQVRDHLKVSGNGHDRDRDDRPY